MEGVLTYKDSNVIIDILFNPFIIGIIIGLFSGNLSLGMITTGFTILLWGYDRTASFIIIFTVLLVMLTGNINFELIYLYFISITYFIKQSALFHSSYIKVKKLICYLTIGIISLALFPVWRVLMGIIPVQIFNDINTAGNFLLIAAVFLSIDRFWKNFLQELNEKKKFGIIEIIIKFILTFGLSVLGIKGQQNYIFVWIIGIIILILLENLKYPEGKISATLSHLSLSLFSENFINTFLGLLIFTAFFILYYLITLNIFLIIILIIISYFFIFKVNQFPYLETIYLLFFIGLLTARIGFLS